MPTSTYADTYADEVRDGDIFAGMGQPERSPSPLKTDYLGEFAEYILEQEVRSLNLCVLCFVRLYYSSFCRQPMAIPPNPLLAHPARPQTFPPPNPPLRGHPEVVPLCQTFHVGRNGSGEQ